MLDWVLLVVVRFAIVACVEVDFLGLHLVVLIVILMTGVFVYS